MQSSNPQILKSSNPQILKSSKSSVRTFARLSSLAVIVSFGCISQAQAICQVVLGTNWSTASWFGCSSSPPATSDDAAVGLNLTLNQNVTVNSLTIDAARTLNASSFTLTLAATTPLIVNGTFTAGTSTVKFSDADHTVNSNITFYNLQWTNPITAPRTITINGAITYTGSTFNLGGSSSTNKVTFTGTGSVNPAVTLTNCTSTVTGITCPAVNPPVAASIGLSLKDNPVIFSEELKE